MIGLISFISCVAIFDIASSTRFCQPEEPCWPSQEEIQEFVASLTPSSVDECGYGSFFSKDEPGPLVDNLWYADAPKQVTPYQLANFRNKITDNPSYFVVIPKDQSDVVKAVKFATSFNLGISVYGTGHEFNDRNTGIEPNGLLIR